MVYSKLQSKIRAIEHNPRKQSFADYPDPTELVKFLANYKPELPVKAKSSCTTKLGCKVQFTSNTPAWPTITM